MGRPAACGGLGGGVGAAASLLLLLLLPPSHPTTPTPTPPLTILQSPLVTQPGQSVTFTPHPAVTPSSVVACSWYRDNGTDVAHEIASIFGSSASMIPGPAHSGREELGSDCALSIVGLLGSDSGIYTLLLRDPLIRTAAVSLTVYEPLPMPEVTPDAVLVAEEDNVTLRCHPPPGAVTTWWHRDDAALRPDGRLSLSPDNLTLTLTAARRGDAGSYGCLVANPISTNRSRDVNVTIAYGPDSASISPPGPLWLQLGAELTLHCSAPSLPTSHVTWGRGNDTLGAGPELHLVLSEPAHFGTVSCRATNPVLSRSANAHVELRMGEGLSGGEVAGIILGVLVGLGLISAGGLLAWKHLHRPPPTPKTPKESAATNGSSAAAADPQYSTIVFSPGGGSAPRPPNSPPSSIYAEVKTR